MVYTKHPEKWLNFNRNNFYDVLYKLYRDKLPEDTHDFIVNYYLIFAEVTKFDQKYVLEKKLEVYNFLTRLKTYTGKIPKNPNIFFYKFLYIFYNNLTSD